MRYGLNLLLWTDTLNDAVLPLLDEIKQIGYDAVELPVFELDVDKYARWGKHLDNAGLARTGVTVRGPDDNPMSPDPAVRRRGVEHNKAAVDCAAAAGATTLVRSVPFGPGILHRGRAHRRRVEMGRREHAARSPNTPSSAT